MFDKLIVLERNEVPPILRHPLVKSVSIGCISHSEKSQFLYHTNSDFAAHAHNHDDDEYYGAICFKSQKHLTHTTCLHELAHLLIPNTGHSTRWFDTMIGITPNTFVKICHFFKAYDTLNPTTQNVLLLEWVAYWVLFLFFAEFMAAAPLYIGVPWVILSGWFMLKSVANKIKREYCNEF